MKIGDRFSVDIQGVSVAEAVLEDIDGDQATIVIPATRVVVAIKQELDISATKDPEVDRIFGGMTQTTEPEVSPASVAVNHSTDIGEGIHGKELDSSVLD